VAGGEWRGNENRQRGMKIKIFECKTTPKKEIKSSLAIKEHYRLPVRGGRTQSAVKRARFPQQSKSFGTSREQQSALCFARAHETLTRAPTPSTKH